MTTNQKLWNFPPVLVRLLARKGCKPLDNLQIAKQTGFTITPYTVHLVARCVDWSDVTVVEAQAFLYGCGLSLDDAKGWRRTLDYLKRRPTFQYLRKSAEWVELYKPLLATWAAKASPNWEPLCQLQRRLRGAKR